MKDARTHAAPWVCGLFSGVAAAAQAAEPKAPAPVPLRSSGAVAVLGEVDVHQVALGDVSTLFDTVLAAKSRRSAVKRRPTAGRRRSGARYLTWRLFGERSALASWMQRPPRSKDVDVWFVPSAKGAAVVALMGGLSWYHDQHGMFIEVWAKETFAAQDWRDRSKRLVLTENPKVSVVVPHPHDVLMAKLERMDVKDREHVRAILGEFPLTVAALDRLVEQMPHRRGGVPADRVARFEEDSSICARRSSPRPDGRADASSATGGPAPGTVRRAARSGRRERFAAARC